MRRTPRTPVLAALTITWLATAGCKCGLDENDGESAEGPGAEQASGGEDKTGPDKSAGTTGPTPPDRLPHPDTEPASGERAERPWGDLDGNGLADPVVGFTSAPPSPAHRSRVFRSTEEAIVVDPARALPGGDTGRPSQLLRRLGDLDADGHADIAVGHGTRRYLRVHGGGEGGPAEQPSLELTDPADASGSGFGNAAAAGDVDGDGQRDLIVGAFGHGDDRGRVYVFAGTPDGVAEEPAQALDGPDGEGARFGDDLAVCDLDGDGIDDLIAGAPRANERRGRVHVLSGGGEGLGEQPTATLEAPDGPEDPERTYWELGTLVASAGDVAEPDGCTVVAAATGVSHSNAYVLRAGEDGEPSLAPLAAPEDRVQSVAAGDLTGDGAVDVVVSTHGSVRVHLAGDGGVPTEPTVVLEPPEAASGYFGADVSVLGDADGDGRSELIVAAPSWKGVPGSAWVFYGADEGLRGEPARLWQIVRQHEDFAGWVE